VARHFYQAGGTSVQYTALILILACMVAPLPAQEKTEEGPTNEKAKKTYKAHDISSKGFAEGAGGDCPGLLHS